MSTTPAPNPYLSLVRQELGQNVDTPVKYPGGGDEPIRVEDLPDRPIRTRPRIELPVTGATYIQRAGQVESVLSTLENGIFNQPAFLVDQMFRDARVTAASNTRVNGLLGLPIKMRPAGNSKEAVEVARLIEGTSESPGLWHTMFPQAELSELMRWDIWLGAGISEIQWITDNDMWIPTIVTWHPNPLWWQWNSEKADTGSYYINTVNGGNIEIVRGTGEWLFLTSQGYRRAWLRGALRALAYPFLGRQWQIHSWDRFNEVHGMPIRMVTVPASGDEQAKNEFLGAVSRINFEANIQKPARKSQDDAEQYGVELIEAKSETWESFGKYLDRIESDISFLLLGNRSAADVESGTIAAAKTSELVRLDYKRRDSIALSNAIREQVLKLFCYYNFGDANLAPYPEWEVEPSEDLESKGKFYASLGGGLASLISSGAPIDAAQILRNEGIPVNQDASRATIPTTE